MVPENGGEVAGNRGRARHSSVHAEAADGEGGWGQWDACKRGSRCPPRPRAQLLLQPVAPCSRVLHGPQCRGRCRGM